MNNDNKSYIIEEAVSLDLFQIVLSLYSFIAGGIVLYNKVDSLKTNYKIKRDFVPRGGYVITIPDENKKRIDNFNMRDIANLKYSKFILHFIDVIRKNFNEEDLAFMVHNFNNLKLHNFKLKDYFNGDGTKGYYSSTDNTIFLHSRNPEEYIYHELFHAASTISEDNVFCVGLANYADTALGYGLNEGYTQFLTKRYFPTRKSDFGYPYLTKIAGLTEEVIGKEKMQSMYMKGELNLFLKELNKYSSGEDMMSFIVLLDNICTHLYKSGLNKESKEILNKALYDVNVLLIRFIINKSICEIDKDKLSIGSIYKKCMPLIRELPANLDFVHFKCNFWNEKTALEVITREISFALNLDNSKIK